MRWMCSQRTRSADIGLAGGSALRAVERQQRGGDVVGVGGLRHVVDGAELHRGDGGGDIAVAGQHDAAGVGPAPLERRDDVEAAAVAEPHVDDGIGRRRLLDLVEPVGDRFRRW